MINPETPLGPSKNIQIDETITHTNYNDRLTGYSAAEAEPLEAVLVNTQPYLFLKYGSLEAAEVKQMP